MNQEEEDTREQMYDEQINPLMARIITICKEHNIPFVASFQLSADNEDDGPLYCTSCSLPDGSSDRMKEAADLIYRGKPGILLATILKELES